MLSRKVKFLHNSKSSGWHLSKLLRQNAFPIFTFILGCMLTVTWLPFDKTCTLQNTDKEHNIMQDSKLQSPDLIILILSAPVNFSKRNTIRETWLKLRVHDEPVVVRHENFKFKHYFVIGSLGLKDEVVTEINNEQLKYGDILVLPIFDEYTSLSSKVLKSFEWISDQFDYGIAFKYVLKCDDDSFVYLDNFIRELVKLQTLYFGTHQPSMTDDDNFSPYIRVGIQINDEDIRHKQLELYWGYFHGNAKIKTAGKWRENDWILCDRYLPYALGGGYVLSKNLVKYLAKNAQHFRLYNSEDISVGAWLSTVKNIARVHDVRFDTEWTSRGCRNYFLVMHNISEDAMRSLYHNIVQTKVLCEKEQTKRPYYLYDWFVHPSQCCKRGIV